MLGRFVTARLKGKSETQQGAVISEKPLIIRGQSGKEYECESSRFMIFVHNPPQKCIGCGLPLGKLCGKCDTAIKALYDDLRKKGLEFTRIETEEDK